MTPPEPSLVTVLGCSPVRIKPQVREVRTVAMLLLPCLGGVEARPAVEHQRAAGRVHVDTGAEFEVNYFSQTDKQKGRELPKIQEIVFSIPLKF